MARILVIGDQEPLRKLLRTVLEGAGHEVTEAPNGCLGLAAYQERPADLVITDIVMPEMNGRDLAKTILSLYPGTKRVFMSGYTADVIAHHGVLDEGVQFIQKPFSIKDFAAKVREVTTHPGARDARR